MASFTNKTKNTSSYSNRTFGKTTMSFDEAVFSWNSAEAQSRTWNSNRGDFLKNRSKNASSYNNRTKN